MNIGKEVLIAANCYIIDANHNYKSNLLPIRLQGFNVKPVILYDGVWAGTNTTILPGATIFEGAIIGANSLVSSSISMNMIAFGSPAKEVKSRFDK